jgi:hypothetical protein
VKRATEIAAPVVVVELLPGVEEVLSLAEDNFAINGVPADGARLLERAMSMGLRIEERFWLQTRTWSEKQSMGVVRSLGDRLYLIELTPAACIVIGRIGQTLDQLQPEDPFYLSNVISATIAAGHYLLGYMASGRDEVSDPQASCTASVLPGDFLASRLLAGQIEKTPHRELAA